MSLTISVAPHELWRTGCTRVHFRDFEHFESCVLAPKLLPYNTELPRIITGTFAENRRCQEGLEQCTMMTIDCDRSRGQVSAEQLQATFPYRAVFHCTKSGEGNWRGFVKLPPGRALTLQEFRAVYEESRAWLPVSTDPASGNPAQPWVPPCRPLVGEYVAFSIHREIIPVDKMLLVYAERVEREELERAKERPIDPSSAERRAIAYVQKMDPAISGAGGHTATFRAAAKLVSGFGLDERTAVRILRDHFNPRCVPKWKEQDLLHKVRSAMQGTRVIRRVEDRPL